MIVAPAATATMQINDHSSRIAMTTARPYFVLRSACLPHPFGTSVWPPAGGLPPRSGRILAIGNYLVIMLKNAFEPCNPTRGTKVPDRPEWLHEVKHDGYRLIAKREGKRVRLFTRNGHDWSDRFPLITEPIVRRRTPSMLRCHTRTSRCRRLGGQIWMAG